MAQNNNITCSLCKVSTWGVGVIIAASLANFLAPKQPGVFDIFLAMAFFIVLFSIFTYVASSYCANTFLLRRQTLKSEANITASQLDDAARLSRQVAAKSKFDNQKEDQLHSVLSRLSEESADDLTRITGINIHTEKKLNVIGVYFFDQLRDISTSTVEQIVNMEIASKSDIAKWQAESAKYLSLSKGEQ